MTRGSVLLRIWFTGMVLLLATIIVGGLTVGNAAAQSFLTRAAFWQGLVQGAYTVLGGLYAIWHEDFLP